MHPFLPTPRETNFLLLLGFLTLGAAIYLRQSLSDTEALAALCIGGSPRPACSLYRFLTELSALEFFGVVALFAAALHFWRPEIKLFSVALVATILGLFLGNIGVSAFAAAILVVAFARPVNASKRGKGQSGPPPSTTRASSRTSR
jgi:hypothetical protein